MSDLINNLQNKVAALTQTVNQLLSSSKSIPELPEQTTLDGSSLLHTSRGGVSEKISVQQIVNAAINNDNDQLLSIGAITLSGNDLTIASISGKINNVVQSIPTPTVVNIPYCATGLSRIDLIVYDANNDIVRIAGTETAGSIMVTPTKPLETLLVTQISVSDSGIGDPSSPILGAAYIKKSFAKDFQFNGSGSNAVIPLNPEGYSDIKLVNSGLVSVSGFDLSLMTGPNFEAPYQGKPFIIWNKTGNDVTLKHDDTSNAAYVFQLNDALDIIIPNNNYVSFYYDGALWQFDKSFQTQKYFNIVANTTLSAIHNNSILRIKSNATVTIPAGLPSDFNFVVAIYAGVTYNQVADTGVTQSPATVSVVGENMVTTFVDGTNNYQSFGV